MRRRTATASAARTTRRKSGAAFSRPTSSTEPSTWSASMNATRHGQTCCDFATRPRYRPVPRVPVTAHRRTNSPASAIMHTGNVPANRRRHLNVPCRPAPSRRMATRMRGPLPPSRRHHTGRRQHRAGQHVVSTWPLLFGHGDDGISRNRRPSLVFPMRMWMSHCPLRGR